MELHAGMRVRVDRAYDLFDRETGVVDRVGYDHNGGRLLSVRLDSGARWAFRPLDLVVLPPLESEEEAQARLDHEEADRYRWLGI